MWFSSPQEMPLYVFCSRSIHLGLYLRNANFSFNKFLRNFFSTTLSLYHFFSILFIWVIYNLQPVIQLPFSFKTPRRHFEKNVPTSFSSLTILRKPDVLFNPLRHFRRADNVNKRPIFSFFLSTTDNLSIKIQFECFVWSKNIHNSVISFFFIYL